MVNIKIDKEMLNLEIYKILSYLDTENTEAKKQIMYIIDLINKAPIDEEKRNFARIRAGR